MKEQDQEFFMVSVESKLFLVEETKKMVQCSRDDLSVEREKLSFSILVLLCNGVDFLTTRLDALQHEMDTIQRQLDSQA